MKSFSDDDCLCTEMKTVDEVLQKSTMSNELYQEFVIDTPQSVIDRIFEKDISVITEIGVLRRSNITNLVKRMIPKELVVFWANLQNTCRYSSMLRACGEKLSDMEQMAFDFMEANKDCAPEQFQGKLFQEMLSGGPMSKRLMSTFGDTTCIKNILSNIGNILKTDSTSGGAGADMFSLFGDMLKETEKAETENDSDVSSDVEKVNIIQDIQDKMKSGDMDLSQLINSSMMG